MRLIVETTHDVASSTVLDESTGQKHAYIQGIFAQAESLNRNKRVYPKAVLEKAIDNYNELYVKRNRACGEIEHPNYPSVNMSNAAMIIESLHWEGNNVIGKARALTTPQGKTLAALINDGVQIGVSTRGLGSVRQGKYQNETCNIVSDDYEIRAIDAVGSPSGIDCFVDGILEGVEYYYKNGTLCEREIEQIQEHVKKNDIEAIKSDFQMFMNKIFG